MSDVVETVSFGKLRGKIYHDSDCTNPYEDDEMVRIVVFSDSYSDPAGGKCGTTPEELAEWEKENAAEWFSTGLWVYDHSGMVFRVGETTPFNCPFDSSRAGAVALKRDAFDAGSDLHELANEVAETYSEWANGECYGFRLFDRFGEEIESCWGFVGRDHVDGELKEAGEAALARPPTFPQEVRVTITLQVKPMLGETLTEEEADAAGLKVVESQLAPLSLPGWWNRAKASIRMDKVEKREEVT